jgi:hypothetical protein
VQEGESVVSLRCTPACGSDVGVCDAGFVGTAEAMPLRVEVGLKSWRSKRLANPNLRSEIVGTRHSRFVFRYALAVKVEGVDPIRAEWDFT